MSLSSSLEPTRRRFIQASLPLLLGLVPHGAMAQKPREFTVGTDAEEHTFTGIWLRAIYRELFKRLGISLKIVVLPLKRINFMIKEGQLDADMVRGPSYGAHNPDLVEVDAPFFHIVFSVYALKPMLELKVPEDLRGTNYRAVTRLGVLYCEESLKRLLPADHLLTAHHTEQSIAMVNAGRAEFFCDTSSAADNEKYSASFPGKKPLYKVLDLSEKVPLKAYLHPKHRDFAPEFARVLKQMDKEGVIERLRVDTIKQSTQITGQR